MEILLEENGKTLTVLIKGKLDATTAPDLEAKISDKLDKFEEIIFDAKDLEYISSAGLRVILKARHAVSNTSVVNTSTEVFDIFEMTGFSEMMKVTKKFRELSVEGCEIIGRGYYGTVYRISKDTIVKVYKNEMSLEGINRERELSRKAFVMGVPTAIPYDVVKVGDNYGSVFELLDAVTLQHKIKNDLEHIDDYIKQYVDVLKIIHSTEVKPGELTDKKAEALGWANTVVKYIDKASGEKLLKLINNIKDDNHMIHGDYHIKNIMVQNNDPFIIDMDTLASGSKIFEFGFMYSSYSAYQEVDRGNGLEFFGIEQDILDEFFIKSIHLYFEGETEEYIKDIIKKARIISYTQLIDRFSKAKDHDRELALFEKSIVELISQVDDLNC